MSHEETKPGFRFVKSRAVASFPLHPSADMLDHFFLRHSFGSDWFAEEQREEASGRARFVREIDIYEHCLRRI